MTLRIAAICAYPEGLNTGMLSVDAALPSALSRILSQGWKLDLFTIEDAVRVGPQEGPRHVEYGVLARRRQLLDYDRIQYWGDFLQSRRYHQRSVQRRGGLRWAVDQPEEAIRRVHRLLLLEDAPADLLRRVICFGNSNYINSAEDESDARYMAAIGRLYTEARLVLQRDPYSAQNALRYAPTRGDGLLGVDCAFLLRPGADLAWPRWQGGGIQPGERRGLGFSFGRAMAGNPAALEASRQLAQDFAEALGLEAVDLDWLRPDRTDPLRGLAAKLEAINRCMVVVSDTYHCALNAWREGVPAVCIGLGLEAPQTTLSEKKKELAFAMLGLRDFYIYGEHVTAPDRRRRAVERIVPLLRDAALLDRQRAGIASLTGSAERRLAAALVE